MIAEALRKVPLFAELDDAELERVVAVAAIQEHAAGTHLFSCGSPSSAFYVLLEGEVRIRIPASSVQEERTVDLSAGAFFGEMGVMRGKARMADADVTADARILTVEASDFDELVTFDPSLSEKVHRALMERLAQARRSEEAAEEASRDPHLLLFVAAGGGEGASFVCANLGAKIHDLTGKSVLLVDLRVDEPSLHRFLGVREPMDGLSRLLATDLGPEDVRAAALPLDSGVSLLADSTAHEPGSLTAEQVEKLIPAAASAFDYVLVDGQGEGGPAIDAAARLCDTTQVVLVAAEASVHRARILHDSLKRQGLDGRVRFVLNMLQPGVGVDPESVEFDLGEELTGRIDAAPALAEKALEQGVPITRSSERSPVAVQVTRLARQLLSLPAGTMEKLRELSFWSLFH